MSNTDQGDPGPGTGPQNGNANANGQQNGNSGQGANQAPASPLPTTAEVYNTKYTYFFIPKTPAAGEQPSSNVPGTVFRLGGHSDLEDGRGAAGTSVADLYPAQHITDAGNTAALAVSKAAGDSDADLGILLGCDGRVLLRSGERIYVQSTDPIHVQSDASMVLKTGSGAIDVLAGANFNVKAVNKVSLRSGVASNDNYTARGVNNSGTTGIEIIADEGNSDVYIEGKSLYLQVNGTSTADITEDNTTIMRANDFQDIWGHKTEIFRGTTFALYFGAGLSYRASAGLNLTTALEININLLDIGINAIAISLNGVECNLKETVFGAVSVDTKLGNIQADLTALRLADEQLAATVTGVEADTTNLKAVMGTVKADLRSLIFHA